MGTGASTAVVAAESTPVEPSPLAHQDTAELSALLKELPEGSRKRLTEALDAVETAAADPAKSAADKKSLLDELIAALKEVPQAMQARLKTALDTVVSDPARAAVAAAASAADHLTAAMVALKDLPQDMRTRLTNAVFTSVAPAPVSAAPSGPPPYYPVAPEDGELNEINLIVEGLYLSNWRGAEDEAQLAELGITHIAAVGTEFTEDEEHGRTFWKKDISDDESAGEEMSKALRDVAAFQHKALKGGGKCLVHCAAGISRSATCVLAYMVIHRKQRLFDALGVVIGARRPIWPNDGFMKALIALEAEVRKGPPSIAIEDYIQWGDYELPPPSPDVAVVENSPSPPLSSRPAMPRLMRGPTFVDESTRESCRTESPLNARTSQLTAPSDVPASGVEAPIPEAPAPAPSASAPAAIARGASDVEAELSTPRSSKAQRSLSREDRKSLARQSSKLAEEDRMSKRLMRKDTWEREGEELDEASLKSVKEEGATEKKAATEEKGAKAEEAAEKAQGAPGKGAPSGSADAKPKATGAKATDSKAA